MDTVLSCYGIEHKYGLNETAFYNYFLRPAFSDCKHRRSFYPQDIDREVSGLALSGVIERLKPNLIIFIGKQPYTEFSEFMKHKNLVYNDIEIEYVLRPANCWWYRNGGLHGKVKFKYLLKHFWLVKWSQTKVPQEIYKLLPYDWNAKRYHS